MSTIITPTEQTIDINVTEDVIDINVTNNVVDVNATTEQINIEVAGAYPLPATVFSVFGRVGDVTAQSGDYTTSLITEGSNLYYTDSRARLSLGAGAGISYNSTTGVITSTITQYTDALARAAISGGTGISYNSTTGVITNTITQYTDALARAAISLTTSGTSGAATYNSTTGVLNVPQYQGGVTSFNTRTGAISLTSADVSGALTYVPVTNARTLTINGTTYDLTADRSWTISAGSGTLTSVGLSMPSGFSVASSPLTGAGGTIAVTGAGNSTQYLDGTGALQTFPTLLSSDNLVKLVRNNSGATMTAGTIVYINGALGNKPTIAKALATGDSTSAQTYGLLQADIANNADGNVVVIGNVTNIDTSALTEGQQLYLSGTTAGTWITAKPQAPVHLVYIGIVLKSHPTQGIIGVKIQNGYELDEIHDIQITSIANNNILKYDSATSLWKNVAGTTTNISEGTNLYYTDARARASISETVTGLDYNSTTGVLSTTTGYAIPTTASQTNWDSAYTNRITSLTTTGSSGAATLTTNVLNIPTYTLAGLGGITLTSLSATTPITYNNTTGVFTISQASASTNGYLASGDFNTFNNKQGALTLTTTGTSGAATLVGNTLNIPQYSGGGGSISLAAIGSTPNANAATLTGSALNLEPASASFGGVVTTGTQTFAGAKTFADNLTVSKNQNNITSISLSNTTSGASAGCIISVTPDSSSGYFNIGKYSATTTAYKFIGSSNAFLFNATAGDIAILNDAASGAIKFGAGGSSTAQMILDTSNNLGLNTSTIGSRLQVNGNAAIGYSASTAAPTNGLQVAGTLSMNPTGAGTITLGSTSLYGVIGAVGTNAPAIYLNGGTRGGATPTSASGVVVVALSADFFITGTDGAATSSKFQVTSGGNIGIGNPTAIGSKMQINGNLAVGYSASTAAPTNGLAVSGATTIGGDATISGVLIQTVTTNRQTASYTLVLSDRGKLVEMNVATANNLTVPLNSSVAFPIGTQIDLSQYGAGQTTVVATGGVTIRSTNSWVKLNAQYAAATLIKIGTDEWYLFGNLNA